MKRSTVAALLLLACLFDGPWLASAQENVDASRCDGAVTATCLLSPYDNELSLQDQVFCPDPDTATGLERQGSGCSSLQYCCQALGSFNGSFDNVLRVVGIGASIQNGVIIVPSGGSVRLEFVKESCVARVGLGTNGVASQGSVLITSYFLPAVDPAISSVDAPLAHDGSSSTVVVDQCRLAAISFRAPTDAALYIQSISACLLDTRLDACGVCNGDGSRCPEVTSVSDENGAVVDDGGKTLASWFEEPDVPIVPTVFCHERRGDKCCTVFGYQFDSDSCFFVPGGSEDNFLIPGSAYQGQPCFFLGGGEDAAFETYWNCTEHKLIHLKWQVNTETTRRGIVDITDETGEWPVGVQVHRNHKRGCPANMCTFAAPPS